MREVRYVEPQERHLASIAARLRQADIDEVWALTHRPVIDVMRVSVRQAAFTRVVLVDGVPEIVFGVAELNVLTRTGAPWALATDFVERDPRLFLRQSRRWRDHFLDRFDLLKNVVDARNVTSVRFLRWLGFTVHRPFQDPDSDNAFCLFELERCNVC